MLNTMDSYKFEMALVDFFKSFVRMFGINRPQNSDYEITEHIRTSSTTRVGVPQTPPALEMDKVLPSDLIERESLKGMPDYIAKKLAWDHFDQERYDNIADLAIDIDAINHDKEEDSI